MSRARKRFWLSLLGLDFILDWKDQDAVDRALNAFLLLIQAAEIVLALRELLRLLRSIGAPEAARKALGKASSRLLGIFAIAMLIYDIGMGWARWIEDEAEIENRYRNAVTRLYVRTECDRREQVFAEEGVSIR